MSSPDPLMALLDQYLTMPGADRRAVEALLSPHERARLATAERVRRVQRTPLNTFDLSPYSSGLAKILLPVLLEGSRVPSKLAPATQDAIKSYFLRGARP